MPASRSNEKLNNSTEPDRYGNCTWKIMTTIISTKVWKDIGEKRWLLNQGIHLTQTHFKPKYSDTKTDYYVFFLLSKQARHVAHFCLQEIENFKCGIYFRTLFYIFCFDWFFSSVCCLFVLDFHFVYTHTVFGWFWFRRLDKWFRVRVDFDSVFFLQLVLLHYE